MGCYEDDYNWLKISKLLLFLYTKSEGKEMSFDKYFGRLAESQESVYYVSGESLDVMKMASALQVQKKELEVLMLDDHLGESCVQKRVESVSPRAVSLHGRSPTAVPASAEGSDNVEGATRRPTRIPWSGTF